MLSVFNLTLTRHKWRKSQRFPISLEHLEIASTKSQFLKPKKCNIFLEIYIFNLVFFEEKIPFLKMLMHKNAIKLEIFWVVGKYYRKRS